jgi:tRNA pseudouridine13 synthase
MKALTYPYGTPSLSGVIKQNPEDFKVYEQLGFEFTGEGEHLFIKVEKTELTTFQLIEIIAKHCGVAPKQVGYSGLKDKQAVTCQWLSVQLPGCKQTPDIPNGDNYRILDTVWHDKKLRVGVHKFNDFEITIRDIEGNIEGLSSAVEQIKQSGFANYFGQQRFGINQDNVSQALRVLGNRHKSKRLSRQKKSLYLSALRSEIFNQILAHRINQTIWMQPVDGDLFMLSGTQSMFAEPLNDELMQRYQALDIHSAVSLMGRGESRITKQALAIENEVLNDAGELIEILDRQEIKRAYRSSRAIAHHMVIEFLDASTIYLKVRLEKGVFLTSLINHFLSI